MSRKPHPDLVMFCGYKGSGKDTAARALLAQGYTKVSFAQPIKDMLMTLLMYQGAKLEEAQEYVDGEWKELPCPYLNDATCRYALQTLGTEWGRQHIAENLWVDVADRRADQFERVAVTDMRFPNEAAWGREKGALILRIASDNVVADPTHVSERNIATLPVDATIENNSHIRALHALVLSAVLERSQRRRVGE